MLGMKGWKLSKVNKDVDRLSYVSGSRRGLWDLQKVVVLEAMLARMRAFRGFLLLICNNGYRDGL